MNIFDVDTENHESVEGRGGRAFQGLTRQQRAADLGDQYSFSVGYSASAGDVLMYLEPTNPDKSFHLVAALVSAEKNTTISFSLADTGAVGTNDVTIINWNTGILTAPQAISLRNTTIPANSVQMGSVRMRDDSVFNFSIADLILVPGKSLYVQTSAMGSIEATLLGYFE